tara:strand:+ start:98 stop:1978 length:1881 start_codon:yes stop_codon:yes gene_type:complete
MPSTVYKGDIAEVSFASETGIRINASTDANITTVTDANADFTKVTFTAVSSCPLFVSNKLRYPKNMLVGSQVKFTDSASQLSNSADTAGVFTIVSNDDTDLRITPAMKSSNLSGNNNAGLDLHILPYKTPPIDVGMSHTANNESVLTDQFLGLTSALTLPETKVDLKRYHIIGLGRDTAVQVPGKFITEGGSFEVAMHSARWLKYCLGGEVIADGDTSTVASVLASDAIAGASDIVVSDSTNFTVDKFVEIDAKASTDDIAVVTTHEPADTIWDGTFNDLAFDKASPSEIRRIVAVQGTRIFLDEPLMFTHTSSGGATAVKVRDYATPATNPPAISDAGVITDSVTHLLFTNTTQPSFSLEVSQRRRNIDTDEGATDGGSTDSKELTRVFRGCKITDFTLTTDNDAALRLSLNFNSALCYTDTGRLEGGASRYASHRMFDDIANTANNRLLAGIGRKTQKPFMFYNGTINIAGIQVAQVLNFNLTGQTGMQAFHTVNGQSSQNASGTSQVPFGASRNTSIMVEGQTSYEMTMEIIVDDPIFYHKMRSATEFSRSADNTTDNQIRINFEKTTTSGSNETERMMLMIDDYVIIEAPLQIPEDKGAVKSVLKIMPKAIKVIARDTILKY